YSAPRHPPTSPLFPYTTLFRSLDPHGERRAAGANRGEQDRQEFRSGVHQRAKVQGVRAGRGQRWRADLDARLRHDAGPEQADSAARTTAAALTAATDPAASTAAAVTS